MKRQGFFTGKIYDNNYPIKDIGECCMLISDKECTDELNKIRAKILKAKCVGCSADGCLELIKFKEETNSNTF